LYLKSSGFLCFLALPPSPEVLYLPTKVNYAAQKNSTTAHVPFADHLLSMESNTQHLQLVILLATHAGCPLAHHFHTPAEPTVLDMVAYPMAEVLCVLALRLVLEKTEDQALHLATDRAFHLLEDSVMVLAEQSEVFSNHIPPFAIPAHQSTLPVEMPPYALVSATPDPPGSSVSIA